MSNAQENLDRFNSALDLNNVKHSWLNYTSAIHRAIETKATLTENLALASTSETLYGLVKEHVYIGATEWFEASEEDPGNYTRHTAGPDLEFKLSGVFQGAGLLDENLVNNLEPHHRVDHARLCLSLRRLGEFPGETLIPREAVTDGITVVTSSPFAAIADEEL